MTGAIRTASRALASALGMESPADAQLLLEAFAWNPAAAMRAWRDDPEGAREQAGLPGLPGLPRERRGEVGGVGGNARGDVGECMICCEEAEDTEEGLVHLPCDHIFCGGCMQRTYSDSRRYSLGSGDDGSMAAWHVASAVPPFSLF